MSFTGPLRDLSTLMGTLTPETLPRLVRDMLTSQGHTNVRITDGTGDGCRDLYSRNQAGERMVTQCKCHRNLAATVTTREVAELVTGLVKFGYKRGLFVTTSRISPQAKRELLDDFPGYELAFLDGQELLGAVLDDAALAALWFDGERLGLVNTAVSVPVIVRRHIDDLPIAIPHSIRPAAGFLRVEGIDASVDVRLDALENASRFESYRQPREVSMVEGMLVDLRCTELVLRGALDFADITASMQRLAEHVVSLFCEQMAAFSVRLGRPALTPLSGTSAGERIVLGVDPLTVVRVGGETANERAWLMPTGASEWQEKSRARVTQMNAVRLYNARLDACAALDLLTPPDYRNRGLAQRTAQRTKHGWERSVFVMHPITQDVSAIATPPPDETLDWGDGSRMYVWFHAWIAGGEGMEPIAVRHEQLEWIAEAERELEESERQRLGGIRALHIQAGAKNVAPRIARHMVGLMKSDPLEVPDIVRLTIADLIGGTGVPSPADPSAREFRVTVCWTVELTPSEEIMNQIEGITSEGAPVTEAWTEELSGGIRFLIVHFGDVPGSERSASTDTRLQALTAGLEKSLAVIESLLRAHGGKRATADYWDAKFFIDCRGRLPEPSLDSLADMAGRPETMSPAYFALMKDLSRTNF